MIAIDATDHSHVVTCSACPPWRAMAGTRSSAWTAAAGHLSRTHGDVHAATVARNASAKATIRARSTDSHSRGNLPDLAHGGATA